MAAIGVAAHEAGHAVQYAVGYVPIKVRNAVIPLSQFGSSLSMPVLLIGLLFNQGILVQLGIVLFSTVALFQLITLPVEFDASSRALKTLEGYQLLDSQETQMAGKVLKSSGFDLCGSAAVQLGTAVRSDHAVWQKKRRLTHHQGAGCTGQGYTQIQKLQTERIFHYAGDDSQTSSGAGADAGKPRGGYSNLVLNETLKKHSFPRPMRHLPASCSTVRWNGG